MPKSNEDLLNEVAHELRQPLSTMEAIAYYLELALPQADPRVLEQVNRLRQLVAQSGWILNDALALARPVAARPQCVDLNEIISGFILDQAHGPNPHIGFQSQLEGDLAWIDFEQAREMVSAIGRLMESLACPGSIIHFHTSNQTPGMLSLRATATGALHEEPNFPAGTSLILDRLQLLARLNSGLICFRLNDSACLDLLLEVPTAPPSDELAFATPSSPSAIAPAAPPAPVAPGIA
jgi:hypothetical protein